MVEITVITRGVSVWPLEGWILWPGTRTGTRRGPFSGDRADHERETADAERFAQRLL